MPNLDWARDGADAVRKFAAALGARNADRIRARLDGAGGMDALCAVEAALCERWPPATAKELVWLTRSGAAEVDQLHLQAFAQDGEVLCQAAFRLDRPGVAA